MSANNKASLCVVVPTQEKLNKSTKKKDTDDFVSIVLVAYPTAYIVRLELLSRCDLLSSVVQDLSACGCPGIDVPGVDFPRLGP